MAHNVSIERLECTGPNPWIEYTENLNSLFIVHGVDDADTGPAMLICKCGLAAYYVMLDLCSPALPFATEKFSSR